MIASFLGLPPQVVAAEIDAELGRLHLSRQRRGLCRSGGAQNDQRITNLFSGSPGPIWALNLPGPRGWST